MGGCDGLVLACWEVCEQGWVNGKPAKFRYEIRLSFSCLHPRNPPPTSTLWEYALCLRLPLGLGPSKIWTPTCCSRLTNQKTHKSIGARSPSTSVHFAKSCVKRAVLHVQKGKLQGTQMELAEAMFARLALPPPVAVGGGVAKTVWDARLLLLALR